MKVVSKILYYSVCLSLMLYPRMSLLHVQFGLLTQFEPLLGIKLSHPLIAIIRR